MQALRKQLEVMAEEKRVVERTSQCYHDSAVYSTGRTMKERGKTLR